MSARKKMRLEDGGSSSSDRMLLEPSATINDLPSEVMKNIFSFVGKGSYCLIGRASKDFCFNYLTMDVIEDKYTHKMDFQLAIGKNKVTTAEAASSSFELAEYCFLKAPEDFQRRVVNKAIRKGRKDIVILGNAMGIGLIEAIRCSNSGGRIFDEIAKEGDLEMFKLLLEKGVSLQHWSNFIIPAAAGNCQLHLLKWLHRNNFCQGVYNRSVVFLEAIKNGNVQMFKWAQNVFNCQKPTDMIGFAGTDHLDHTAKSDGLELIQYFRSQEISWSEYTIRTAAKIGNIAFLEYLLENGHPNEDPGICSNAAEITDRQKALEVLQLLHEHNIPWDESCCEAAARSGNLKALEYLRANDCPWNENCLFKAVMYRHYDIAEYCLRNNCPMGNSDIYRFAVNDTDHTRALRMLKLLREFSLPWSRLLCAKYAAGLGNIEALKWMRSQDTIFEEETCIQAAMRGRLETLKWLRSEGCPIGKRTFLKATTSAIFEYCIENDIPCDGRIYESAVQVLPDPIPIIKLLRNSGYPWHPSACAEAAKNGDVKLLRWLRFNGCAWDESVCNQAVKNNNLEILKYAHENGCEWSKETYACCFSDEGLDAVYYNFPDPDEIECSQEIFDYLIKHKCPEPDQSDWNIFD